MGKMAIHLKQLYIINSVFSDSPDEIELAKKIVTEYEKALEEGHGAIKINGQMVDIPVYKKAKDLIHKNRC